MVSFISLELVKEVFVFVFCEISVVINVYIRDILIFFLLSFGGVWGGGGVMVVFENYCS